MNIVKFDPAFPMNSYRNLFDEFFNRSIANVFGADATISTPSVNVIETPAHYQLEVAAPGLSKEHFEVQIDAGRLTVSAHRAQSEEKTEGNYKRREFNYTSFNRSFQLPEDVVAEQTAAAYNNGILTLTLPKKEEAKVSPTRVIEIK